MEKGEPMSGAKQLETRLKIVDALQEELKTMPLEKVKVSHLCEKAGISRTTFYSCFEDLFNVSTWLWDYLLENSLYRIGLTKTFYTAHKDAFTALLRYKGFFARALQTQTFNSVYEYAERTLAKHYSLIAEYKAGRPFTAREKNFVSFYSAGAASSTRMWAERGMVESPEEMASLFNDSAPPFLKEILDDHLIREEGDDSLGIARFLNKSDPW